MFDSVRFDQSGLNAAYSHQPGTSRSHSTLTLLAASAKCSRDTMQNAQPARKEEPFFLLPSTGADFEDALRYALRANVTSMNHLHATIGKCMESLRADGMECEAALITMKAFIRQLGLKHRRMGSSEMIHSEHLMDQIVRWCISDFYIDT